jgi:hypothetical protein
MIIRHLRGLLAGTAIAFAVVAAVGAGPAGAATVNAAPVHWTTHAATASSQYLPADEYVPDAGCGVDLHVFKIWATTCSGVTATTACTSYDQGRMPLIPSYASNGCEFRVWIYTGANKTGNNLCINPKTSDGSLDQNYVWFWVSNNKSNC